jgi:hypothetical protein
MTIEQEIASLRKMYTAQVAVGLDWKAAKTNEQIKKLEKRAKKNGKRLDDNE